MKGWLDKLEGGNKVAKKEESSMLSTLTNKFGSMFEGMDFTSKMKKANELIPIVKMIPGGEKFLKDQAYRIATQHAGGTRSEEDVLNNSLPSSFIGGENRDLVKLAVYGDDAGFKKVPQEVLKNALIPLKKGTDEANYKNIPSYFTDNKNNSQDLLEFNQVTDSIPYSSILETTKSLLNRNRERKELALYEEPQLTHKADSVLNSITPTNSVIYSTGRGVDEVRPPYSMQDNLAGYVARLRRDAKTNALWYDQNDVWDFDSNYSNAWAQGNEEAASEQAKAMRSISKPFRLISTNPVAKPKKEFEDGGTLQKIVGYHPVVAGAKKLMSNFAENTNAFEYDDALGRIGKNAILNQKSRRRIEDEKNPDEAFKERADLLNLLANKEQQYNSIPQSRYKPTKGKNANYLSSPLTEKQIQTYVDDNWNRKNISSKEDLPKMRSKSLGNMTLDFGKDKQGSYISYYDKWDLNPIPQTGINWLDRTIDKVVTGVPNALGITNTPEVYGRVYLPEKKNGGIIPKAEDGLLTELTPQQKHTQYLKQQAQIGAGAVRKGRDQFAKDYITPLAKGVGSFTPIGPVIGMTDAYNAWKNGDSTGAIIGAGLETLPYGVKYGSKVVPFVKNFLKEAPFIDDIVIDPVVAAKNRAERMLAQKQKWSSENLGYTEDVYQNINNHFRVDPAAGWGHSPKSLGVKSGDQAVLFEDAPLTSSQQKYIASHETGHLYSNSADEANQWLNNFNTQNWKGRYLRGRPIYEKIDNTGGEMRDITLSKGASTLAPGHANEIRERAAQLKEFIAYKKKLPLNKDFTVTQADLDDAIKTYTSSTGLDNNMTEMLSQLKNKKGFLKAMNEQPLSIVAPIIGAGALANQKKDGGELKKLDDLVNWTNYNKYR